ncbi:MAG: SMC family ATPase, partial [Elainellaceae cyanobacterium]
MRILSVTLKNFKAHGDRHYTFELGTNVICGENGAGKTSILEAIAWTIFNYRGDYRKEDLIRNGAASAQATVSFVSSHDERTYDVQRCTSKGYALYDPQLNQRLPYTRIDDEVMPWLRQHLGVAPGTNLARLFSNTIGVPQGTFAADFLQTGEKRKQVFDTILKVEEFKQVYTGLNSLRKYSEGQVETLKREVAHYEETLVEQAPLQQTRDQLVQAIHQDETRLHQLEQTLAALQAEKDRLSQQAQHVQSLEGDLKQTQMQQVAKQQEIVAQKQALDQAQQAVQRCEANREGHDVYLRIEASLTTLEQQVKQRRTLMQRRDTQQQERSQLDISLAKLMSKLEEMTQTATAVETLTPLVQQQDQLEQRQKEMQQALQTQKQRQVEREGLERQVEDRRTEWFHLSQDIKRIQAFEATVAEIPTLEQQRDRLQSQ